MYIKGTVEQQVVITCKCMYKFCVLYKDECGIILFPLDNDIGDLTNIYKSGLHSPCQHTLHALH